MAIPITQSTEYRGKRQQTWNRHFCALFKFWFETPAFRNAPPRIGVICGLRSGLALLKLNSFHTTKDRICSLSQLISFLFFSFASCLLCLFSLPSPAELCRHFGAFCARCPASATLGFVVAADESYRTTVCHNEQHEWVGGRVRWLRRHQTSAYHEHVDGHVFLQCRHTFSPRRKLQPPLDVSEVPVVGGQPVLIWDEALGHVVGVNGAFELATRSANVFVPRLGTYV